MALRFLSALAVAAVLGSAAPADQAPQPTTPPATGTGMIAGRVVDADSGQGIPGAVVTLSLARQGAAAMGVAAARYTPVLTDSQGRFAFSTLPAGQFFSTVERDGYSSTILTRIVELGANAQVTDFIFRMNKFNTVLGTVRDDVGDPLVGSDVLAFVRAAPQGRPPVLVVRGRGRTDDRGQYRLNNLPAGHYVICACSRDTIPFDGQLLTTLAARPLDLLSVARRAAAAGSNAASLDSTLRTYAPTFYPNTPLASRAERVAVEKGETKPGVDITVATVRAVRVSGQVIGLPPSSISAGSMRLVPVGDTPEAAAITQLPPMLVQPDGRFDFSGVPPGTYSLEIITVPGSTTSSPTGAALAFLGTRGAPAPPPPPPPPGARAGGPGPPPDILWAFETVSVGEEDVTGLVVALQRGISVRGKIEFAGSSPPPEANTIRGVVQMAPMELRPARSATYNTQVNPDGTFAFVVPPGRYVIPNAPSVPPAWSNLRSITAKGVEITDAALTIEGDIPDMIITLTNTPAPLLVGTAELPADAIPEEWAVLIFPSDRRLWREPFGAVRRFLTSRLTAERTFHPRLPAGDYLLALSRGVPQDWMEATALEELSKGATSVTVADGDKKAVQVKR